MKKDLTDRYLRSLKPPQHGRIEVSDTKRPGLRFRLSASGKAMWMFEKRVKGGAKRKHTFGAWPEPVGLADARAMALEIEAEAIKGIDRVAIAQTAMIEAETVMSRTLSVERAIEVYHTLHLSDLRTGDQRRHQLKLALVSKLNDPITSLKRSDLQAAIDAKAQEGRKVLANRIRAALSALTGWLWGRGYIETDIGLNLPKATKEVARERAPSILEVRRVWEATYEMGELWGPAFRLLILTAQRRGEILGLRKSEVDLEKAQIVKPGALTKNTKAHITHLSPPALAEVTALISRWETSNSKKRLAPVPAASKPTDYLFTTTGSTPISGVSKAKARFDRLLGDDFEPWRFHDLRTAFSTAMVGADVPEGVADRVLNHSAVGSAPSAVSRVYALADMLPQRAAALDRWAEMVTGERSKVVCVEAWAK